MSSAVSLHMIAAANASPTTAHRQRDGVPPEARLATKTSQPTDTKKSVPVSSSTRLLTRRMKGSNAKSTAVAIATVLPARRLDIRQRTSIVATAITTTSDRITSTASTGDDGRWTTHATADWIIKYSGGWRKNGVPLSSTPCPPAMFWLILRYVSSSTNTS